MHFIQKETSNCMDQETIEKIFNAYSHLGKDKYLGCFCKDQMKQLKDKLYQTKIHSIKHRHYGLINIGNYEDKGEHWIGLVVDFSTDSCGYFDSFDRSFKWLNDTLKTQVNNVHKSKYVLQSNSTSTCGLHSIYFIINMMDDRHKSSSFYKKVNVGEYNRQHYETSNPNVTIKDIDIVNHLSKKFKTNFSMLLKPFN